LAAAVEVAVVQALLVTVAVEVVVEFGLDILLQKQPMLLAQVAQVVQQLAILVV